MTIFTRIINKEIPANILYEDNKIIAFYDINPKGPGHFLVVPKKHSTNLMDIEKEELKNLILKARDLALKEIKKQNVSGFQLVINSGASSGQEVFHTHIHIIPSSK